MSGRRVRSLRRYFTARYGRPPATSRRYGNGNRHREEGVPNEVRRLKKAYRMLRRRGVEALEAIGPAHGGN